MSRPLVAFRAMVNELLAEGIAPTPAAVAERGGGKYVDLPKRTFRSGHLAKAREEELIKAGWRRVCYTDKSQNFRWVSVKRKSDTFEGKRVRTKFRIGDTVICFTADDNAGDRVLVVGYDVMSGEGVWVMIGKKRVYLRDDQMVLAVPSPDFPLK